MKTLTMFMCTLLITMYANADLTTGQKLQCAKLTIEKVLNTTTLSILPDSINLENTPMEKYNIISKAKSAFGNSQPEQNYVTFYAMDKSDQMFKGEIIMITHQKGQLDARNNNTTTPMMELLSDQSYTCSLTVTQFKDSDKTTKNIDIGDLHLQLIK